MVNIGSKKIGAFLGLFIGIMIVIIINQISTKYFFRTDLTEEKRFTISKSTIQILENLQDAVYIDVYLDGDLPAPFKRSAIRDFSDISPAAFPASRCK